jgi:gamma-glutamyl hercynylcysteine S-oxide synthase
LSKSSIIKHRTLIDPLKTLAAVPLLTPSSPISMDSPQVRYAAADVLSLALMDARNHTLYLMAEYEKLVPDLRFAADLSVPRMAEVLPPLWLLGHAGWFQEYWIGRNTQRHLGLQCPRQPALLASIEPRADACFDPRLSSRAERWTLTYPDLASIKSYLLETLETSLELLEKAEPTDAGLYFFRLALAREDQLGEQFIVMAQTLGLKLKVPAQHAAVQREAIVVPAMRWRQGASPEGFSFDNEGPQHEVHVPEFEIDAQPITWAQFVEFVDDGGYDNMAHWSEAAQMWLKETSAGLGKELGRRAPRHVEQIGSASGAVMQMRFGTMQRMASGASAVHLTWHEAQAYVRWAGRRLPTEVEWEIAASRLSGQGFRWGDVWEWTINTFRPYPGFVPSPWHQGSTVHFEHCKVLRGACWATRERMKQPTFRGFARPERDGGFYGFRTCAV